MHDQCHCGEPVYALGLCLEHYDRWRKRGDTEFTEDLADVLHWVMDGEALTTEEERKRWKET